MRLFRSTKDSYIAGVCGGIAKALNIDSTIVRLFFIGALFFESFGVLAYIILALLLPINTEEDELIEINSKPLNNKYVVGIGLIALGVFSILRRYVHFIDFKMLIAVILVGLGIYILFDERGKKVE